MEIEAAHRRGRKHLVYRNLQRVRVDQEIHRVGHDPLGKGRVPDEACRGRGDAGFTRELCERSPGERIFGTALQHRHDLVG